LVNTEGNLKAMLFNPSRPLLWQQVKVKNIGCTVQCFFPIFFNMLAVNKRFVYNKKIKSWAKAHWDANTQGRFAIMPYVPAPLI